MRASSAALGLLAVLLLLALVATVANAQSEYRVELFVSVESDGWEWKGAMQGCTFYGARGAAAILLPEGRYGLGASASSS